MTAVTSTAVTSLLRAGGGDPDARTAGTFRWRARTLAYESIGEGDRVVVLVHGLLLDARSNRGTARRLADAGFRAVSLDLLGHGASDRPDHASEHRIDMYGEQVVALLDHLGVDTAVLVGTSLGANTALFVAAHHPDRVRGLVIEMPVLEWAVPAAALTFVPMLLAVHYGGRVLRAVGAAARSVRTPSNLVEAVLDVVRADPDSIAAVLHGILVGPVAPTVDERRAIAAPVLVLAHRGDPIHPHRDARNLERHLEDARLVTAWHPLELRLAPRRLLTEVTEFLDACWPAP
jgi:pimeloyl-ACP methyl ester carboxylesterase